MTQTRKKGGRISKAALQKKKQNATMKLILFIVLTGVFVLFFVSLFAPGLEWLKNFSYTVFGLRMYVMPFILIAFVWFLLYWKKDRLFYKRLIASVLILFALGGVL